MTACELDGSVRIIIDRDRHGVTWRCPFCKSLAREDFELDARNDVQRSFDR
jgi:hypothetical protein